VNKSKFHLYGGIIWLNQKSINKFVESLERYDEIIEAINKTSAVNKIKFKNGVVSIPSDFSFGEIASSSEVIEQERRTRDKDKKKNKDELGSAPKAIDALRKRYERAYEIANLLIKNAPYNIRFTPAKESIENFLSS